MQLTAFGARSEVFWRFSMLRASAATDAQAVIPTEMEAMELLK
jgi:hypothetical protein